MSDNDNSTQMTEPQAQLEFKQPNSRLKYGRMIVFEVGGRPLISLGPNYICFTTAFAFFVILGIMLTNLVYQSSNNFYFRMITLVMVISQNLSYFLVAIKNPGIITNEGSTVQCKDEQQNGIQRFCKRCGIMMARYSYHCRQCDVCISGYDHHCPWTSKCIGKGNLILFYIFVSLTPLFLVYSMIAFTMCAASNALEANSQLP